MILSTKKGYSLVELMVVVTIIGILVSIILAAANSAKSTAHDNQRISDIQLLQIKLEAYKNNNGVYPGALSELVPNYINAIPTDPIKHTQYDYVGTTITGATACLGYHMRAQLEKNEGILQQDADENAGKLVCADTISRGPLSADFTGDDSQFYYDVLDPTSSMRSWATINNTPVNNGGGNTGGGTGGGGNNNGS